MVERATMRGMPQRHTVLSYWPIALALHVACTSEVQRNEGGAPSGGSASEGASSPDGGAGSSAGGSGGLGGATASGGFGGGPIEPDCESATEEPVAMKRTPIASGFSSPILVTHAPGQTDRLYVVEQGGKIKVIENGTTLETAFGDLTGLITTGGERGLLGLAFSPEYETSRKLYVNYTNLNGDTVVSEWLAVGASVDPESERILLTIEQPFSNHNGGHITFGPDGMLYIGMGDGGGAGDPFGAGQDVSTKLAKMLRIDVSTYPTPAPGNMPGGDPDIWDLGLRNPWRFSFDSCSGGLYIGDVGQGEWEEVNYEPRGDGHKNYGWNSMEGTACYTDGCDTTGLTLPIAVYPHSGGNCSITGGYVYRGSAIPSMTGRYVYGDYCSKRIWALTVSGGAATDIIDLSTALDAGPAGSLGNITSFGQDAAGEIYIVDYGGTVFRLDPA